LGGDRIVGWSGIVGRMRDKRGCLHERCWCGAGARYSRAALVRGARVCRCVCAGDITSSAGGVGECAGMRVCEEASEELLPFYRKWLREPPATQIPALGYDMSPPGRDERSYDRIRRTLGMFPLLPTATVRGHFPSGMTRSTCLACAGIRSPCRYLGMVRRCYGAKSRTLAWLRATSRKCGNLFRNKDKSGLSSLRKASPSR
jgi:hypothetical protein